MKTIEVLHFTYILGIWKCVKVLQMLYNSKADIDIYAIYSISVRMKINQAIKYTYISQE